MLKIHGIGKFQCTIWIIILLNGISQYNYECG